MFLAMVEQHLITGTAICAKYCEIQYKQSNSIPFEGLELSGGAGGAAYSSKPKQTLEQAWCYS